MPWLDWLHDHFTWGGRAHFPAMLRVRDASGQPVPVVDVEYSCGRSSGLMTKTLVTASGLCLLEWPPQAVRLSLLIRAADQQAQVEIERVRDDPERVIEVRLA